MGRWLQLYPALFRLGLAENIQYRASGMIWMIAMILEPVIFLVVWGRVAEARGAPVGGYDAAAFAAYYLTLMMANQLTFTWVMETFQLRIQMGDFSYELLRPVHPIHGDITTNVAFKVVMLMIMLPAVVVVALAFHPRFTLEASHVLIAGLALAIGFMLRFLLEWTLALAAFWTTRVSAFNRVYYSLATFLSGRAAPLAVLPTWLAGAAMALPFYYCVGFPVEIFLGRLPAERIARGLVIELVWLGAAALAMQLVWRRALRRYSAVGA